MSNISNPLSISNIAWDIKQDDLVGNLLKNLDVKYIDIAPSKYILNFYKVSKNFFHYNTQLVFSQYFSGCL